METKLFTAEQIKRYFDRLSQKGRNCSKLYKGIDKLNPDREPCEKEIFVERTLRKWFAGKYIILFQEDEMSGREYKRYIYISSIRYGLGYNDDFYVTYLDYNAPYKMWNEMKISHNDALRLEGFWCENGELHKTLLEMMKLNISDREFTFDAYDWDKYESRGRGTKEEKLNKIKTTVSVFAKTHKEAYKKLDEIAKNSKLHIMY